ncbi:MAG: hydrolase [Candidatus Saccharibacteria bacterium]|nr:hydrolase [Candidatus Saccharibacteria bacterium]
MLSVADLESLPSPFYRVAVKALVLQDNKLLMVQNSAGAWEVPGGGWEHGEDLRTCLNREFKEELGVELESVSDVEFVYRSKSEHGWAVLRVAVRAQITSTNFAPSDGMTDARFFSRAELLALNVHRSEAGIKDYVDQIWRV